jgi:hypothetical protein
MTAAGVTLSPEGGGPDEKGNTGREEVPRYTIRGEYRGTDTDSLPYGHVSPYRVTVTQQVNAS